MKLFFLFIMAAMLSGCGLDWERGNGKNLTAMEFPVDAIKLLSPAIRDPNDPAAFNLNSYEIKPEQNLLLRFEKLREYYKTISTDAGKVVRLQVQVLNFQTTGPSTLELCPLTRNWTMHATWTHAHPFGPKGVWENPGGDFSQTGCVVGEQKRGAVSFDITRWSIDYPRASGLNLGLLLKSTLPVVIAGEQNAQAAPRLFFDKWVAP